MANPSLQGTLRLIGGAPLNSNVDGGSSLWLVKFLSVTAVKIKNG